MIRFVLRIEADPRRTIQILVGYKSDADVGKVVFVRRGRLEVDKSVREVLAKLESNPPRWICDEELHDDGVATESVRKGKLDSVVDSDKVLSGAMSCMTNFAKIVL